MNANSSIGHLARRRLGEWQWVAEACGRQKYTLAVAAVSAVGEAAALVAMPLVVRFIVDTAVTAQHRRATPWLGLLVCLGLLAYLCGVSRRYLSRRAALAVEHGLRTRTYEALLRGGGPAAAEMDTGDVITRMNSDTRQVRGMLTLLPQLATAVVSLTSLLAAVTWLSPLLAAVGLLVCPALWWAIRVSRPHTVKAFRDAQAESGAMVSTVDRTLAGREVTTVFGQEERELRRFTAAARRHLAARRRMVTVGARYEPLMRAVPALGQVAVFAVGGLLAIRGDMTLGTFVACSTYLARMDHPVWLLALGSSSFQEARVSIERLRAFAAPHSRPGPGTARPRPDDSRPPTLEFDAVRLPGTCSAGGGGRGADLNVRAGETVVVVGATGSGKSALCALAAGHEHPAAGTVRIAGYDLRELPAGSLGALVAAVSQEDYLFRGSIGANIAYGRPDATRHEIEAASRAAGADAFVERLPASYDTRVGAGGHTLSGGQRQRIALARALLSPAPVLVLDDATSALDAPTEARVLEGLRTFKGRRTIMWSTNRLSALSLADRVAVMDRGRLVDVGTPAELARRCDVFRRLTAGRHDHPASPPATPGSRDGDEDLPTRSRPAEQAGYAGHAGREEPSTVSPCTAAEASRTDVSPERLPASPGTFPAGRASATSPGSLPAASTATSSVLSRLRVLDLVRSIRTAVVVGVLLSLLDSVLQLAFPLLLRHGVDAGVDAGVAAGAPGTALATASIAFVLTTAHWAAQAGAVRVVGLAGEGLLFRLRVRVFGHMQRLRPAALASLGTGTLVNRLTTDLDLVSAFVQQGVVTALVGATTLLGVVGCLCLLDPHLLIPALAAVIPLAAAARWFSNTTRKLQNRARHAEDELTDDLHESLGGLRVIRTFGRHRHHITRYTEHSRAYLGVQSRAELASAAYAPLADAMTCLATALTLYCAMPGGFAPSMTTGSLVAALSYLTLVFAPLDTLSQTLESYRLAASGFGRVASLLDTPAERRRSGVGTAGLRGEVTFHDVHFRHPGAAGGASLENVSLHVPAGQTIALVGTSGAGKTTVLKLLAGLHDADSGTIRIDGLDIRHYAGDGLRTRIGYVPQHAYLFPGTVADAIAYGRPDAAQAEIEQAARAVGAHDFITRLPARYGHRLDPGGSRLSSGQRQLLTLARAALTQPVILLLDEPTATLDPETGHIVSRAVRHMSANRTTFIVTHRIDTADRADRVVVMEEGRVVEAGPPHVLRDAAGPYARLAAADSPTSPSPGALTGPSP